VKNEQLALFLRGVSGVPSSSRDMPASFQNGIEPRLSYLEDVGNIGEVFLELGLLQVVDRVCFGLSNLFGNIGEAFLELAFLQVVGRVCQDLFKLFRNIGEVFLELGVVHVVDTVRLDLFSLFRSPIIRHLCHCIVSSTTVGFCAVVGVAVARIRGFVGS
jgi:hypothetical protein